VLVGRPCLRGKVLSYKVVLTAVDALMIYLVIFFCQVNHILVCYLMLRVVWRGKLTSILMLFKIHLLLSILMGLHQVSVRGIRRSHELLILFIIVTYVVFCYFSLVQCLQAVFFFEMGMEPDQFLPNRSDHLHFAQQYGV
jgi:hypothetical protein